MARSLPFQLRGLCIDCGAKHGRHTNAWRCMPCSNRVGEAQKLVRRAIVKAIKDGSLKNPKDCACVDCGSVAMDYDHRSYARPLDVAPVCRSCNQRRGPASLEA